jgi:hypothetical protein
MMTTMMTHTTMNTVFTNESMNAAAALILEPHCIPSGATEQHLILGHCVNEDESFIMNAA